MSSKSRKIHHKKNKSSKYRKQTRKFRGGSSMFFAKKKSEEVPDSNPFDACEIKVGTLVQYKNDSETKIAYVNKINDNNIKLHDNDIIAKDIASPYVYQDMLINLSNILNFILTKPYINVKDSNKQSQNIIFINEIRTQLDNIIVEPGRTPPASLPEVVPGAAAGVPPGDAVVPPGDASRARRRRGSERMIVPAPAPRQRNPVNRGELDQRPESQIVNNIPAQVDEVEEELLSSALGEPEESGTGESSTPGESTASAARKTSTEEQQETPGTSLSNE